MLSKEQFEEIVERLKAEKPFLFSLREDGTMDINMFVLQEVLKQSGYDIKWEAFWQSDTTYCLRLVLLRDNDVVYETHKCKEGLKQKETSFEQITAIEISLLERLLKEVFEKYFRITIS